jgi:Spy/CpxP family protein refolding chaperone
MLVNPRTRTSFARLALATAVVALLAASAAAQPPPPRPPDGWAQRGGPARMSRFHGGPIGRLLAIGDEIKLTDAQRTQLKEIRRRTPSVVMPKQQVVIEAQMDLRDLMQTDKAEAAQLKSAHDKVMKARNDLASAVFDLRIEVRNVLTPEQRNQIRDRMHDKARERMRGRRDGRMGSTDFDDWDDDGEI